jgi:hypothetical protein
MIRTLLKIACVVLVAVAAIFLWARRNNGSVMDQPKAAAFMNGRTSVVTTVQVGQQGGTVEVHAVGTPVDGITIQIPEGSLAAPISLSVGYNDGKLSPSSGVPSNIVVVLTADRTVTFGKYITADVSFTPNKKYKAIIGYSIGPKGLRPLDVINVDMARGKASFVMFTLTMFTWVYAE